MYKRSSRWRRVLTVLIILAIIFGLGAFLGRKAYYHYRYPLKYTEYVSKYAAEYGVEESLIYAVINVESGFDPEAVSEADAIGLMQMREETFDWVHERMDDVYYYEDLYKPEVSIQYGTKLLSLLLEEYEGDEYTALAAYHAGMGSVNSWLAQSENSKDGKALDSIPKEDTTHYVNKVQSAKAVYEKYYAEELSTGTEENE